MSWTEEAWKTRRGSTNPISKVTEPQVILARRIAKYDHMIAMYYLMKFVSQTSAFRILKRERWSHI